MRMTERQQKIHEEAVHWVRARKEGDFGFIDNLIENEKGRLYKFFGKTGLFQYLVEVLGLSEPIAGQFKTVVRKAIEVPELSRAIRANKLSICKASRIVSALDDSNAEELVKFASKNTWRAIEAEMARRRPSSAGREKIKPVNEQLVEVKLYVTPEEAADLEKAQNLMSSKQRGAASLSKTTAQAWREFVLRHDPVKKAERAQERKNRKTAKASDSAVVHETQENPVRTGFSPSRKTGSKRVKLTAEENHAVNIRDQGRCTFVDEHGNRCTKERWLEKHHKIKVSEGGTNEPSNLTTLCWSHHDLVHQLNLPLDGQVTWLRERIQSYRIQ
jgi:hypothetical protein